MCGAPVCFTAKPVLFFSTQIQTDNMTAVVTAIFPTIVFELTRGEKEVCPQFVGGGDVRVRVATNSKCTFSIIQKVCGEVSL